MVDLKKVFGRFAGREIEMVETPVDHKNNKTKHKTSPEVVARPAHRNDPVLAEMQAEARKHNLTLRVWFPGTVGTQDYRRDRLNVKVRKGKDGKYRICDNFICG